MAYAPVFKDLTAVKTKVLLNLTKRKLICFGGGALIGMPLFFLLKGPANLSASGASLCMVLVMLPFFLMTVTPILNTEFSAGLISRPALIVIVE